MVEFFFIKHVKIIAYDSLNVFRYCLFKKNFKFLENLGFMQKIFYFKYTYILDVEKILSVIFCDIYLLIIKITFNYL